MTLTGRYDSSIADRLASSGNAIDVTPSDTVDLTQICRAFYLGVAGNVKVITGRGDTITFTNMLAGCVHPISVMRIFSTDTTATGIVALY